MHESNAMNERKWGSVTIDYLSLCFMVLITRVASPTYKSGYGSINHQSDINTIHRFRIVAHFGFRQWIHWDSTAIVIEITAQSMVVKRQKWRRY